MLETSKLHNRYLSTTGTLHTLTCPASDPRACFTCQMHKFAMAIQDSSRDPPIRLGTKDLEAVLPDSRIDDTSRMAFTLSDILDLCKTASRAQGGMDGLFNPMVIQSEVRRECTQCKRVLYKTEQVDTIRGTAGNVEGADVAAATYWSIDSWAAVHHDKFECPACHSKAATV